MSFGKAGYRFIARHLIWDIIMNRYNTYITKKKLRKHQARRKAQLMSTIEERKILHTRNANRLRYVGLVLVQGSSALILLDLGMTLYWTMLWFGLLCYNISAIFYFGEDNRVYRMTKMKFKHGMGSSLATVNALAEKRIRERVMIFGNTIGLGLIAYNWILSIS